jgi:hypothetical protein
MMVKGRQIYKATAYSQVQFALLGQSAFLVQWLLVQVWQVACFAFLAAGTRPFAKTGAQANNIAITLKLIFFILILCLMFNNK